MNSNVNVNEMMMNVDVNQSDLITSLLKLIKKSQKEAIEVCAKEYNFDIDAAMRLVGTGGLRKERKEKVVKERKEKVVKVVKEKAVKEKKIPTASGIAVKEKSESKRGRPKSPEKVVEVCETENLFEQLVNNHIEQKADDVACEVVFQTKEETKVEQSAEKIERGSMSDAEKETKTVLKSENKLQKESVKAAEKLAEKLAKENAKMIADAEKEKIKVAKAAEKLAKEQTKAEEKMAKETEKKTEKLVKKSEKAIAKAEKKSESGSESDSSTKSKKTTKKVEEVSEVVITTISCAVVAEEATPVATLKLKPFKYEGVKYYREKTTMAIYDVETNDHLGQWNEATQKIEFLEQEEELESESESESEEEEEELEEDSLNE